MARAAPAPSIGVSSAEASGEERRHRRLHLAPVFTLDELALTHKRVERDHHHRVFTHHAASTDHALLEACTWCTFCTYTYAEVL